MSLMSKDDLWKVSADLPCEDVQLRRPSDGHVVGTMRIRGMTGEEVNEWQDAAVQVKGKVRRQSRHTSALLIIRCAINEDGSQFFDSRDLLKISQMPGYILMQLTEVALRLSGLGDDDEAKELVEGFDDGPSELSTSG